MKILFTAAECAPFFKTGGLGDVAGALPKAIQKLGHEVCVFLPYHRLMPKKYQQQLSDVLHFEVAVGWRQQYCGVKTGVFEGVRCYFIDNAYYFDRATVYGEYDDGERFAFFQLAVIESMEKIGFIPDVLHVNDYHTAFIPYLLQKKYHWIAAYNKIRTLVTIHNIEFQGNYDNQILGDLFGIGTEEFDNGQIEQSGQVNWLKAGIVYANQVNTVSPSYAQEIQTPEFGKGLDSILRQEQQKVSGIVNGIDYDQFDSTKDAHLFVPFDAEHLENKRENKCQFQKMLGLPIDPTIPLIGVVSRLTHQKGFHLVVESLDELLQNSVQLVILGTGEQLFEEDFRSFENRYPEQVRACITFDLDLAQKIYGSADLFLMPSAFEPCGLSQMMAMRYGTLPIVHEIGGLKDTVWPFNPVTHEGTGFGFQTFDAYWLKETVQLALHLYQEVPDVWKQVVKRAMTTDFSWDTASHRYIELYDKINQ